MSITKKKIKENTEDDNGNSNNCFYSKKCLYNYPNTFMVSWWENNSYLNNEQIQIGDIEIMNSAYGSSG